MKKYIKNSYFLPLLLFGIIIFSTIFFGYDYILTYINTKNVKDSNIQAENIYDAVKYDIKANPNVISQLANNTSTDDIIIRSTDSNKLVTIIRDDLRITSSGSWVIGIKKSTFQLDFVLYSKGEITDKYIKKYNHIEDQIAVAKTNGYSIGCYYIE